jgi:hypothetical protein
MLVFAFAPPILFERSNGIVIKTGTGRILLVCIKGGSSMLGRILDNDQDLSFFNIEGVREKTGLLTLTLFGKKRCLASQSINNERRKSASRLEGSGGG